MLKMDQTVLNRMKANQMKTSKRRKTKMQQNLIMNRKKILKIPTAAQVQVKRQNLRKN